MRKNTLIETWRRGRDFKELNINPQPPKVDVVNATPVYALCWHFAILSFKITNLCE